MAASCWDQCQTGSHWWAPALRCSAASGLASAFGLAGPAQQKVNWTGRGGYQHRNGSSQHFLGMATFVHTRQILPAVASDTVFWVSWCWREEVLWRQARQQDRDSHTGGWSLTECEEEMGSWVGSTHYFLRDVHMNVAATWWAPTVEAPG